jgi:hypothetical protein
LTDLTLAPIVQLSFWAKIMGIQLDSATTYGDPREAGEAGPGQAPRRKRKGALELTGMCHDPLVDTLI